MFKLVVFHFTANWSLSPPFFEILLRHKTTEGILASDRETLSLRRAAGDEWEFSRSFPSYLTNIPRPIARKTTIERFVETLRRQRRPRIDPAYQDLLLENCVDAVHHIVDERRNRVRLLVFHYAEHRLVIAVRAPRFGLLREVVPLEDGIDFGLGRCVG